MTWLDHIMRWLGYEPAKPAAPAAPAIIAKTEKRMDARRAALVASMRSPERAVRVKAFGELFPIPPAPPGVPGGKELALEIAADMKPHYEHAMDWQGLTPTWAAAGWHAANEGIGFFGFPYLAELTQRAEYRLISEIRAEEMTRKWIKFTYGGEKKDQQPKFDEIEGWFKRHGVRQKAQLITEQDGYFGRSHLYIDTGATDKPNELKTRLIRVPAKIKKGSIVALRVVEPLWTYPNRYNAADPLRPDYFNPETWFVMGKLVHKSRLLTFVSRPMPDLLKAAYAFGGLSLSQMAKPYVDNWLNGRQSVADLLRAFSTMILATDMQSALQGGTGEDLDSRVDLFNAHRSNFGTMITNRDSEELTNIAVPLGTLDKLQAQAQEHMATVARTPLVKLFGITPSGLNASSDGEIRAFYDGIHALQEKFLQAPLEDLLTICQLDLFGDVDPGISFEFVSLWELDEAGQALVRKTDADTGAVLIESGALDPEEERKRIADDPKSPYAGLDPDDMPEPPEEDLDIPNISGDPAKQAEPRSVERSAA